MSINSSLDDSDELRTLLGHRCCWLTMNSGHKSKSDVFGGQQKTRLAIN
jgi:hypothetical protein